MNSNELKSFFETTFPSLVATKELANRLLDFQIRFVTKNQDHMEFFGGNLTGVHIVRFTPADMDRFFLDVLDIEEEEVKDGLFALPGVNKKHKVASDPFNNVCMYLIHIFLNLELKKIFDRN